MEKPKLSRLQMQILLDAGIAAIMKRWKCACGWEGVRDELIPNPSGCLCCPKCGGSGGLI